MEEDHHQGQKRDNHPGQGEIQTSETRTPVGIDAGVGQSVTEASLGIPTIGVIPTDTHDYVAPSPDLDLSADGDGNDGDTTPPFRGFRGRWLSRDRNLQDEADETGPVDEEAGGTPRVDWDMESVPANPEQPTGVVVDERDAKVLANHTFLSNVKWSSISMPWESGFVKNIFGEDVLGLSSDLRQAASG